MKPSSEDLLLNPELLDPKRRVPRTKDIVYVFETDMAGTHRSPSGKTAVKHYSAVRYRASGMQGRSYAVPLYGYDGETPLSMVEIRGFVEEFIAFAHTHPEVKFKISPLGQLSNSNSIIRTIVKLLTTCPSNCYLDDLILKALHVLTPKDMAH
jgi:hypothetical protein